MFNKIKLSSFMFIIIGLFLVADIVGYFFIKENLALKHTQSETIIFSNIQTTSSDLLTKMLYKYSLQKDILITKHKEVLSYINQNGTDTNLSLIYETINKNNPTKPYNIYITDDNLTIKNTTFAPDIGFNLSFAKELFDTHKKANNIGISAPIFESLSMKFNSYSDSYLPLPNDKKILQVSYTYQNLENELEQIATTIDANPHIKDVKAYILFSDGYIGDFIFKSFKPYKPTLEEVKKRMNEGLNLSNNLASNKIIHERITIDGEENRYKAVYFVQNSPIFDDAKIIYEVVFDDKEYNETLRNLTIFMILLTIFGVVAIFAIFQIRFKELLLSEKEMFIKHSIHEIKTPLSIISLNNQQRVKKYGADIFSSEIENAIKVLKNSYNDMTFLLTNKKMEYKTVPLKLASFIKQRVEYFDGVAKSQGRDIVYNSNSNCIIEISEVELTRLIDNNLINALKYAKVHSTIEINLEHNLLIFASVGNAIIDVKKIFNSYERENETRGGLGLGLSIVKNIADKYNISIDIKREDDKNIFLYSFKCEGKL